MSISSRDSTSYLGDFIRYLEDRSTIASQGVDRTGAARIYESKNIEPFLRLGKFDRNMSRAERKKFIGEVFALSLYAKKNEVSDWEHEPSVNGLTPDFAINGGDAYVEVYSPVLNHGQDDWNYYAQTHRRSLGKQVQDKSSKYKDLKLVIIVNIVVGEFEKDFIETLQRVQLRSANHKIYFYHGDRETLISQNIKQQ